MLFIRGSEPAAHIVSLVAGTVLIAIVFLVADRVYGRRVAFIGAALAAVHPLLIALSASIYNEALYATIWMGMMYWALRAPGVRVVIYRWVQT